MTDLSTLIAMAAFCWDDAAVARLKELYGKGLTAAQIAAELGCPSRSSVLGKLDRMRREQFKPSKPPKPALPYHPTLIDLDESHCKWPMNDDMRRAIFCGQPREDGSVYCADHHRMAYVRSPSPRRVPFRDYR
jgi:hypothetical protein